MSNTGNENVFLVPLTATLSLNTTNVSYKTRQACLCKLNGLPNVGPHARAAFYRRILISPGVGGDGGSCLIRSFPVRHPDPTTGFCGRGSEQEATGETGTRHWPQLPSLFFLISLQSHLSTQRVLSSAPFHIQRGLMTAELELHGS